MDTQFNKIKIDSWKIHLKEYLLSCNIRDLLSPQKSGFHKVASSYHTDVFKCLFAINGTVGCFYLKQYLCRSAWDFIKHLFAPVVSGLT
jgi:hypothetical protein